MVKLRNAIKAVGLHEERGGQSRAKRILRLGSPYEAAGRFTRESWNVTTAPGGCATSITGEIRCAMEPALCAPRVASTIGTAQVHRFRLKLPNMGSSEWAEPVLQWGLPVKALRGICGPQRLPGLRISRGTVRKPAGEA